MSACCSGGTCAACVESLATYEARQQAKHRESLEADHVMNGASSRRARRAAASQIRRESRRAARRAS